MSMKFKRVLKFFFIDKVRTLGGQLAHNQFINEIKRKFSYLQENDKQLKMNCSPPAFAASAQYSSLSERYFGHY